MNRHSTAAPTEEKIMITDCVERLPRVAPEPAPRIITLEEGREVGCPVGRLDAPMVGLREGRLEGCPVGCPVGLEDGMPVGKGVRSELVILEKIRQDWVTSLLETDYGLEESSQEGRIIGLVVTHP